MANQADRLLQEVRHRPVLVVVIGVGAVALAQLSGLSSRFSLPGAAGATDTTDPTDPATDTSTSIVPGGDSGQIYGGSFNDLYNPFGGQGSDNGYQSQIGPYTTPGGCTLPKPMPDATHRGKGDFVCNPDTRSWEWRSNLPSTSPGGCPLPKPTVPTAYHGRGQWVCDTNSHHWLWRWTDGGGGGRTYHPPKPYVRIAAGTHRLYQITPMLDRAQSLQARNVTMAADEIPTGPAQRIQTSAGPHPGGPAYTTMAQLRQGAHSGWWIPVKQAGVTFVGSN